MIQMKRAYEPASRGDGFRVLIDRLWPRGIKKENLAFHVWMKDIAPSSDLRKEFGHELKHWKSFQAKYKRELKSPEAKEKIRQLAGIAKKRTLTLVYGARDEAHNDAVVLKKVIEKELES